MAIIRFKGGISRVVGSDPSRPYDMKDCRLHYDGLIHANPEIVEDPSITISSSKPIFEHNGSLIAAKAGAYMHGNLYVSTDSGLAVYESGSSVRRSDIPAIYEAVISSSTTLGGKTEYVSSSEKIINVDYGIMPMTYVTYLLIPVNRRGEAGPWVYVSAPNTTTIDGSFSTTVGGITYTRTNGFLADYYAIYTMDNGGTFIYPYIEMKVSLDTAYIDVYRTSERTLYPIVGYGFNEDSATFFDTERINMGFDEDNVFYYVGTAEVDQGTTGTLPNTSIEYVTSGFKDNKRIIGKWLSVVVEAVGTDDDLKRAEELLVAQASLPTLDRDMPVTGHTNTGARSIIADHMYNDAGVMLYGSVQWPTSTADSSLALGKPSTWAGSVLKDKNVVVRRVYESPAGTFYGEAVEYTGVSILDIPWRGEAGIDIYIYNSSSLAYEFFRRLTPNEFGRYAVSWKGLVAFYSDTFETLSTIASSTISLPYSGDGYISEPGTILMSAINRPMEVTFRQFSLPNNEPIAGMWPARLPEDENIRSYEFYISTGEAIYVAKREEYAISAWLVDPAFRIKTDDTHTLVEPIRIGSIVVDSGERVYLLSGRQLRPLDTEVRDLWGTVKDMIYHRTLDEVWLLTDRGVYIYSFPLGGWIANYDLPYTAPTGYEMLLWYNNDAYIRYGTSTWYQMPTSVTSNTAHESDVTFRIPELTLQDITMGAGQLKIDRIRADYEALADIDTNTAVSGNSVTLSVTAFKYPIYGYSSPIGAWAFLYNQADPPLPDDIEDFRSLIASMNGSTITLEDNSPFSGTGLATIWTYNAYIHIDTYRNTTQTLSLPPRRWRYPKMRFHRGNIKIGGFRRLLDIEIDVRHDTGNK